jgi:uncharacterized membrane protein YqjE
MEQHDASVRLRNGNGRVDGKVRDASLGDLVRQLSTDMGHLMQSEVRLARAELQESAATAAKAGAKVGVAVVLALPGLLAVTAAAIVALGNAINSYALSALIVGVVILAVAGVLFRKAMGAFSSGLVPRDTVETVREDVAWAKDEARRVKERLTS